MMQGGFYGHGPHLMVLAKSSHLSVIGVASGVRPSMYPQTILRRMDAFAAVSLFAIPSIAASIVSGSRMSLRINFSFTDFNLGIFVTDAY